MALFGKKKKAEPAAAQPTAEDEIQVVGGDADETDVEDGDGQVIDFDAIADELGDDDGESELGDPLGNASDSVNTVELTDDSADDDLFATTPGFEAGAPAANADEELDFDTVFDEGTPTDATPADATLVAGPADDNPFGAGSTGAMADGAPDIAPVADADASAAATPPLTYTAPMTTADMAADGHAPKPQRSLPLLPLLGAAGLLLALGFVGYTVFNKPATVEPVVATNPAMQMPATDTNVVATNSLDDATAEITPLDAVPVTGPGSVPGGPISAPGAPSNEVNQGLAVDGVPIAPGAIIQNVAGSRPQSGALVAPASAQQQQLKALWNKGAAAKQTDDFAGARAAWSEILRLDPGHKGIQEAIDKLP